MSLGPTYSLTLDPIALERCFVAARILDSRYDRFLEYGLVGLSTPRDPLHVVETPFLTGQRISSASVFQAGRDVLRLRREVELLSERRGESLIPIAFVHRHPGACDMSYTDEQFLTGVFVDQVGTNLTMQETLERVPEEFDCCSIHAIGPKRNGGKEQKPVPVNVEFGIAFSLIVNGQREFSISAARQEWCPYCGEPRVKLCGADLAVSPRPELRAEDFRKLMKEVEVEMDAKIEVE